MRRIVIAFVVALAAPAAADTGGYFSEAIGVAGYRGELAGEDAAPRVELRGGVRRGPSAVELFGAWHVPDLFFIDCYGAECAQHAKPRAALGMVGIDLRYRWHVLYIRKWLGFRPGVYERPGLFASVRAGPRWGWGLDAIDGRRGPGVGVAASLEANLWVIGYFLDVGIDAYRLSGGGDTVHASSPYLMIGGKLGWL